MNAAMQSSQWPAAPWHLQGNALLWLYWQDADQARSLVPAAARVIRMLPGRTLGALYVARYQSGSTLEYSEMIVARALSWHRGHIGAWLPQLWVDDVRSRDGGRAIWGLPKQCADFRWSVQSLQIIADGMKLCELEWDRQPAGRWRLPLLAPITSLIAGRLHSTSITGSARLDRRGARVLHSRIPGLDAQDLPTAALRLHALRLHVPPPAKQGRG